MRFRECPACAERHRLAAALMAEHPDIRRSIGSPSIAEHRAARALDALAAIGQAPPDRLSAEHLSMAVDLLAPVARRWSGRFAPVRQLDALIGSCAEAPFGWLSPDGLSDLRHAGAEWLAWRLPPRPVACPTIGCGFCDVGTVTVPRWAPPWTARSLGPASLGGVGGNALAEHLCPACEAAYADPVPSDAGILASALLAAVDPDRRLRRTSDPDLRGLRGWAVTGLAQPNPEPWAHVDLDALRRLLEGHDW